jgi:hypothetical protein
MKNISYRSADTLSSRGWRVWPVLCGDPGVTSTEWRPRILIGFDLVSGGIAVSEFDWDGLALGVSGQFERLSTAAYELAGGWCWCGMALYPVLVGGRVIRAEIPLAWQVQNGWNAGVCGLEPIDGRKTLANWQTWEITGKFCSMLAI